MAVREGEDRRLGSGPEKLLTLEEAARRLNVPADDVEALIRSGQLTAFRLGGSLLRVRYKDVEQLQFSRKARSDKPSTGVPSFSKLRAVSLPALSPGERLIEFLQFNDFYLVAILIILTLLALIFAL